MQKKSIQQCIKVLVSLILYAAIMTCGKSEIGMEFEMVQTSTNHHYNHQWWEYADDKNPPHLLMTYSHHGGILSWWELAGKP